MPIRKTPASLQKEFEKKVAIVQKKQQKILQELHLQVVRMKILNLKIKKV